MQSAHALHRHVLSRPFPPPLGVVKKILALLEHGVKPVEFIELKRKKSLNLRGGVACVRVVVLACSSGTTLGSEARLVPTNRRLRTGLMF